MAENYFKTLRSKIGRVKQIVNTRDELQQLADSIKRKIEDYVGLSIIRNYKLNKHSTKTV